MEDAETYDLHPQAVALAEQLLYFDKAGRAVLPPGLVRAARAAAKTQERWFFLSLCVLSARLAEQGQPRAAEQFADLAKLGLSKEAVESTIRREQSLRHAAASLSSPVGPSTATGLKKGASLSFGLRGGARVPNPKKP